MQHPMLPEAWGEQPHKLESPHESTLALFSKYSKLFFQRFLHLFYARKSIIWD